jgi:hypothetical protein
VVWASIDHKMNMTAGGHNIVIDMIPNDVAASCLALGKSLLDNESEWFSAPKADARSAP